MTQPSLFEAAQRRDKGIHDSAGHAGGEWVDDALTYVEAFTRHTDGPFLGEQVREWAEARGLAAPPDGRAWGAVMQAAKRRHLLRSCGYAPARSSNLSPKVLWEVA
jgi:hypothetical protein